MSMTEREALMYEIQSSWLMDAIAGSGLLCWLFGDLLARYFAWSAKRKHARYVRFLEERERVQAALAIRLKQAERGKLYSHDEIVAALTK
jgi:hypothetical protein